MVQKLASRPKVLDPKAILVITEQATREGMSTGRTNAYFIKLQAEQVHQMSLLRAETAWWKVQRSYPALHRAWSGNKPLFLQLYAGAFAGAFATQGGVYRLELATPNPVPKLTKGERRAAAYARGRLVAA